MLKNPENFEPESEKMKEGFFAEEKKFAEKYSKSVEKQNDDFGFAEKEREENEAAALREKFNEMTENTPEEDKMRLRGELLKEEAERLEKKENEQIEEESQFFENYEDRDRYKVFLKAGLIKNLEQYNENRKFFKNRSANKFKLFIDFYKINTSEKFKEFLDNENNLEVLSRSRIKKIEFMVGIFSAEQFQSLLKEERFKLFLETGSQDVLKDYLDFNNIKNPEEIQKIFTDGNLEYILFSEVKSENSKYVFSNFIKNPEDIKRAFEKKEPVEALISDANIDNLKYVVDLYQINTLDDLENFCGLKDAGVRTVLQVGNLENLREFSKFCENSEEFKKLCNELNIGYGLSKTNPENFAYLIENGIIDKNNLFYLREDWIDRITSLINIDKNNEDEIAFLKRMKEQYPDVVYNTLRVLKDQKDKNQDNIDIGRDAEGIFEILDKLGNITSVIYDKIRKLNKEERNNYAENIKEKMEQIKEKYGTKDFNTNEFSAEFSALANFVDGISEADFKILCSDEMVKKINKLGGELDLDKDRALRFLLSTKDNMVMKKFLKDEIVFSEVKGAPVSWFSETNIESNRGEPTLYGR